MEAQKIKKVNNVDKHNVKIDEFALKTMLN